MNNDILLSSIMTDAEDAIKAIIKDTYICDFGIVKEVLGNGSVVAVEISVANSEEDLRVVTCVLANTSSSSVCLNVVPKENDKVLVLYPRRYDSKMFGVDKEEAIINEYSDGYNSACGIAILMNQAKSDYKNVIKVDDGKVELSLAYDKDNKKNLLKLTTNEKGEVLFESDKVKFDTTDGLLSIEDKNGVKFTTDSNGCFKIIDKNNVQFATDSNGCFKITDKNQMTIESNANGVLINSHLLVK